MDNQFPDTFHNFTLRDLGDRVGELKGRVKTNDHDIGISIEGFGTFDMDNGPLVWIELYEGDVRVLIWRDINQDDPFVVSLQKALESNREEETE
jgi:hypothetical protein